MIFRGKTEDGKFIIGLDASEIFRLQQGHPLLLDLSLIDGKDQVTLMYGETVADLTRKLEQMHGGPLPVNPWPEGQ